MSVVRIDLNDGTFIVLRMPMPPYDDIYFERFASLMFNSAPGVATPEIALRKLPGPLAKRMQPLFNSQSDQYQELGSKKPIQVSVSLFYEATVGTDFLTNAQNNFLSRPDAPWNELPKDLRRQLADHWALYAALAIPDFHPNNWLIDDGRVVAIDLALRSSEFDRGHLSFQDLRSPVRESAYIESENGDIVKDISSEMRAFLGSITGEHVKDIAQAAEFQLTTQQIEGVIVRARALAKSF
jgi:hypothetical protein